ncbi:MAG: Tn3 family transposase [Rhodobacteraceae bacterium]|nr:Tn3 family transposase [Paracoccaceae bacterium]
MKVEELHALARAVYYGQRGRINARDIYDQMKTCSCLTLILACIIYWQARELSRLSAAPDFPFDHTLLQHISPIQWSNVILYGEIRIDADKLWINAT